MECEEFKKEFEIECNCCISCHEDDETGYGNDLWFEIPYSREWHICCEVERAYKRKHDAQNRITT